MSEKDIGSREILWKIHETHPDLVKPLRAKLEEVKDPEIGLSVIQLGLIRQVQIKDDVVKMDMILTTPFCPYGSVLIESARAKAQEALPMAVDIQLGMEAWDFSMMEDPDAFGWGLTP